MPAPYSDNLYSALDDGDDDEYTQSHTDTPTANADSNTGERDTVGNDQPDEDDALSPSDGYFHASDASAYEPTPNRQSANVPDVPNVLVDDPTLRDDDRDTKTREAENERRLSNMAALQQQTPSRNSGSAHQSPPATSSRPTHSHRRSVEEDDDLAHIHDSAEQASQNPSYNQYQSQHQQQQRPSQPNLSSPLFQQQPIEAPPAYTPSAPSQSQGDTTPHSPTSTNSTGLAYQTFGSPPTSAGAPMGNPSEHSRLLGSNREPESMGGVPGDQPQTFWQRIKRAFSIRDGRDRLRKFLKWTLVFVIIISIVSGFSLFGEYNMHDKPKDLEPPKEPSQPQEPEDPRKPTRPPVDGGDSDNGQHNNLAWKPRSYCHQPDSLYRLATTFDPRFISSNKLTIVQELLKEDDPSQRQPHVEGEVVFRRSSKSNPSGEIILEILSNQRDLGEALRVGYESSTQHLLIRTPRSVEWPYSSGPCIQMRVTVYAPENAALEYMTVNTTHLNIDVMEGLDLWVQDHVHLRTVSGDINTPKPQSGSVKVGEADPYVISKRQTIVRTVSGDIKGSFALNDLLQIDSISGTVNAIITPKEVDPDAPSPAKLIISTKSGTITAEEPISNYVASLDASTSNNKRSFPARDYIVDINSYSGTIHADLAFSSSASIRSQSSALKLKMLPIMDPSAKWRTAKTGLTTNTKSGDTDLLLYDPIWTGILQPNDQRLIGPGGDDDHNDKKDEDEDPWIIIHPHDTLIQTDTASGRAFGNLVSHHGSISGTMKLRYPSTWEGSVRAETISGTQKVRGEDLDIYDISTPVTRTVMGRKGKGSSELKVSTVSGSEDILIGKESS